MLIAVTIKDKVTFQIPMTMTMTTTAAELRDAETVGVIYSTSSDVLERHMGGLLAASSFKKKIPQDICKLTSMRMSLSAVPFAPPS